MTRSLQDLLRSERRILQRRKPQIQTSQRTKKRNQRQFSPNKMNLLYNLRSINLKMHKMNLNGSALKLKFKDDELIQSRNSCMKPKDFHSSSTQMCWKSCKNARALKVEDLGRDSRIHQQGKVNRMKKRRDQGWYTDKIRRVTLNRTYQSQRSQSRLIFLMKRKRSNQSHNLKRKRRIRCRLYLAIVRS